MRLKWPDFVTKYYESQDKVSDSEIALNLDCVVDRSVLQPVYVNLISTSIMPIILFVLIVIMWNIISFVVRRVLNRHLSHNIHIHYIKGTVINMLFLLHPRILKNTMEMFACTIIERKLYLDVYMADECWTGDHAKYTLSVALPAFIIWGIGLPCFAFFRLKRLNSKR